MKMRNYILTGIGSIALAAIVYFGFIKSSETDHDHEATTETEEDHHGHDEGKSIHLNKAQIKNANIRLGWFEMKNINEVIHANGHTKLPPQNEADVSTFADGIVRNIKVIEGDFVKKGQLLATVESPEITKMQQNYLVSKANLAYLELEYERQLKLSEQDINAKKILEKTKAELEVEQANYNAYKSQLRLLKINGDGHTTTSAPIIAPISGNITDVYIRTGSSVEAGKPLFSLVDNSEMHVDILVYEKDLDQVEIGQSVRIIFTNQANKEIAGTIFNIGRSFENETKTVAVHADIDDKTNELIPGMYVNAIINTGGTEVETLPTDAIVNAEGRSFIFVTKKKEGGHHGGGHADHGNHSTTDDKKDEKDHGHDHAGGGEDHHEGKEFKRIEVKVGEEQLGFVQVTLLEKIPKKYRIVVSGAYYLQSHLQKSEGGGGHSH